MQLTFTESSVSNMHYCIVVNEGVKRQGDVMNVTHKNS